tara:strand:- start:490 stop:720 length:231 start_codon:yes stop_codon:yes gene_type:complete
LSFFHKRKFFIYLYGPCGAGIAAELKQEKRIDIIQAGFSKGFCVIGGCITGKNEIINSIRRTLLESYKDKSSVRHA